MPSISSVLIALTCHAPGEPFEKMCAWLVGIGGTISANAATDQATCACTSCLVIPGEGVRSALAWPKPYFRGAIDLGGCRIVADRPVSFVRTYIIGVEEVDIAAHMHSVFVAGARDGDGIAIYVADVGKDGLVVVHFDFAIGTIKLRPYTNAT